MENRPNGMFRQNIANRFQNSSLSLGGRGPARFHARRFGSMRFAYVSTLIGPAPLTAVHRSACQVNSALCGHITSLGNLEGLLWQPGERPRRIPRKNNMIPYATCRKKVTR